MIARGLTLLETLAVAVLLSLATGLGVSVILRVSDSPGASIDRLRQIDAQMRLLAQRSGPVDLCFDDRGRGTHLRATSLHSGHTHSLGTFRHRIAFHSTAPADSVVYDSLGRSEDLTIRVEGSDRVLHVAGLTGWTWESKAEGSP